ncbi:MAG: tRNA1(Val) (adenine(37)-N6)-methyltransferase [Bacilli bacterium]|nr:tRNA1(Val) (adenine(37)-N6)-methyltransferase [Bacilli bacterium]
MEVLNDLVGKNLKIYQDDKYFKFSLESILLSEFVNINLRDKKIIDLCSGNCPIPLILSLKTKAMIYAVELQKEVYELGQKSIAINNKEKQITLLREDVSNLKKVFDADTFDIVTVNPPYFKVLEKSLINQNNIKATARHENSLTLDKLLEIAFYLLKTNGSFYMVHRTERLMEILECLKKYNLTPKEIKFIYPKKDKESKLFMIKATKNGKEGIKVKEPLFIHNSDGTYRNEILKCFQ